MRTRQYTIRRVSERLDDELRRRARREGRSLNTVAMAALLAGVGFSEEEIEFHDLDDLAGTWVPDPEFDKALEAQDRVDEAMWR